MTPQLTIGALHLANPTVLAPLAGIGNLPFRHLAKQGGCGLVCAEMISANGLVHRTRGSLQMLAIDPAERPISIQIFGNEPALMAEAGRMVEAAGADILDINCGCSVRKVLKTGSGAALMRDPAQAERILSAVRAAVRLPLTVKIRSGWEPSGQQALEFARMAQGCGVQAIAVHPRTATQGFGGKADWSIIGRIREALTIPVIGNGDIACAAQAMAMFEQTGCAAVMIGRASVGNPWLFGQIVDLLEARSERSIGLAERFAGMRAYLRASVAHCGERVACRMMRSRLGWFTRGLPGSSHFREALKQVSREEEALVLLDGYAAQLHTSEMTQARSPDDEPPAAIEMACGSAD